MAVARSQPEIARDCVGRELAAIRQSFVEEIEYGFCENSDALVVAPVECHLAVRGTS